MVMVMVMMTTITIIIIIGHRHHHHHHHFLVSTLQCTNYCCKKGICDISAKLHGNWYWWENRFTMMVMVMITTMMITIIIIIGHRHHHHHHHFLVSTLQCTNYCCKKGICDISAKLHGNWYWWENRLYNWSFTMITIFIQTKKNKFISKQFHCPGYIFEVLHFCIIIILQAESSEISGYA